jgi:hypothetical protein
VRLLFHLLISRFTPYYVVSTKDYSLDKEQSSYDDLLDALRLSLKGYNIE